MASNNSSERLQQLENIEQQIATALQFAGTVGICHSTSWLYYTSTSYCVLPRGTRSKRRQGIIKKLKRL